jgi:hypothetical protein
MNNSLLAVKSIFDKEPEVDREPSFREKEGELMTILGAIQKLQETKEWSTLKEKVFDGLTSTLNKEILNEAKKENPDTLKLARLTGQLKWAEKYSDLSKLEGVFRQELTHIRKLLYGKTKENPG